MINFLHSDISRVCQSLLNAVNFYNLLVHIVDIVHNDQVTSVATCSGQKQLVTVN
mgnify:CR=1 FL=1